MTEAQKKYYQKNRERILEKQKKYNAEHKETKKDYDFRRSQTNRKRRGITIGINRGNRSIYAANIPGRKKACLVCEEGNNGTIVATFQSEEAREMFEEYLKTICSETIGGKE